MNVFAYSEIPHARRHGPVGYREYSSFKPWLRDEFAFRCVYCLFRERWYPNGQDAFGVDHIVPKSTAQDLGCSYDNLLYACNRCNSAKGTDMVIDPCSEPLGTHLRLGTYGELIGLTKEGEQLIDLLNLNCESVRNYRKRKLAALWRWQNTDDRASLTENLTFPADLPDLSQLRCDNSRPDGIDSSYFVQQQTGVLPEAY